MGNEAKEATRGIESSAEEASNATRRLGSAAEESGSHFTSLSERVANFKDRVASVASGIGVFNMVQSAVDGLKDSVGDAASRVDTLNNANRV